MAAKKFALGSGLAGLAAVLVVAAGLPAQAATMPDNMTILVNQWHVTNNGTSGGALGAFGYDPSTGRFYTAVFGSGRNIRCFDPTVFDQIGFGVVSDDTGTSWGYAFASDIERVTRSPDIPAGITSAFWGGSFNTSSMITNPAPLTYQGVFYDTGKLAIMSSTDYWVSTPAPDFVASKLLMTYDLREIGSATSVQPDYDTAQDGIGNVMGAIGVVDWNDAFTSLVNYQQIADVLEIHPFYTRTMNAGRQAAWASDASAVYFNCRGTNDNHGGGVWRVNMTNGSVERLLPDILGPVYQLGEPHVVPTALRDFTGGLQEGDQILFRGTSHYGNLGGVNCIVDAGVNEPNEPKEVYEVISNDVLLDFIGSDDPNRTIYNTSLPSVSSITADPEGNLYLYVTQVYAVYMYDVHNRLVCVKNRAQNVEYDRVVGVTPTGGTNLRLQYTTTPMPTDPELADIGLLMFHSQSRTVGGIYLFKPLDFNRDGVVDLDDALFFQAQLNRTWSGDPCAPPLATEGAAYHDYLKADLTGNASLNDTRTGLAAWCVDEHDIRAFHQFMHPGDTNFDYAVDLDDWDNFVAGVDPAGTGLNWSHGDFNFDGAVDIVDFAMLKDNYSPDGYEGDASFRAAQPADVRLVVNLATGEILLDAQGFTLDAYQIHSPAGSINPDNFTPLADDAGTPGWTALFQSANYLFEGQLLGVTTPTEMLSLGKTFNAVAQDLELLYNGNNVGSVVYAYPWDLNNDGKVDELDLVMFASRWLAQTPGPGDCNSDGRVDLADFACLAQNWLAGI